MQNGLAERKTQIASMVAASENEQKIKSCFFYPAPSGDIPINLQNRIGPFPGNLSLQPHRGQKDALLTLALDCSTIICRGRKGI